MLVKVFYLLLVALVHKLRSVASDEYPAPLLFTEEPKNIQFSSQRSEYLHCRAEATSSYANTDQIIVSWRYDDGSPVQNISNTLTVLPNGTLWFHPFQKLILRIHRGKFQCVAKLSQQKRAILSRMAFAKGVILKPFKVAVEDQYVTRTGGKAVFTCVYPREVSSYVQIERWWIDKEPANPKQSGHLIIDDVSHGHTNKLYYCVVLNLLTNEILASNVAKLFIQPDSGLLNSPLTFSIPPTNRTTFVGETVLLECLVSRANMEYTWKHNNKDIKLNHRYSVVDGTLRITNPSLTDSGRYTCEARHKTTGKLISGISYLHVQAPLVFLASPVKICTSYHLNVTLQCEVTGYPKPSITWYKDAQRIVYSSNTVRKGNDLVVTAYGKDEGIYQCIADNGIETVHRAALLIVGAQPPLIAKSLPKELTLNQHDKLDISCKAVGDREATLNWYRDGQLIDDTSDSRIILKHYQDLWTLQIKNITAADSGTYRCEAKNRAGMNFSEANIRIKGSAKITFISRSLTGLEGRDVNLTCKAKGFPAATISWFDKNNNLLPISYRQITHIGEGENILVIKSLKRVEDKGRYTCRASNSFGPADYDDVHLSVAEALPETYKVKVKDEGSAELLVCLRGSEWSKDGKRLSSHLRINIKKVVWPTTHMLTLHITNITMQDAGNYTCIKRREVGISRDSTEIVVITRPRFTDAHRPSYNVLEHENVQMTCRVSGFPIPRVEWQRMEGGGYKPIPKSPRFSATLNGSLNIFNVTETDETRYSCIVYNSHANVESRRTMLNVNVPAKITNWLANSSGDAGGTTRLNCSAAGDEKLIFAWLKNKQRIVVNERVQIEHETTSSQLIIKGTTVTDAGLYTCQVKNTFGEDEKEMTIKIRDKPFPPVLSKFSVTKTSITIFLEVEFDGNSPIMSYIIKFKKSSESWSRGKVIDVPANGTSYEIIGLRPYTSYNVQVRAKNVMGPSNASKEITAETDEDAPSAAPTLTVIPYDKSLRVQWERLSLESSSGIIQGYVIRYRQVGSESEFNTKTIRAIVGTDTVITGLQAYTLYELQIQAFTRAGYGPYSNLTIKRTREGVPNQPPVNINVTVISSTSVYVSWKPPPESSINGILVGYRVSCETTGPVKHDVLSDIGNQTNITLRDLGKYTRYIIKVAARTRRGVGRASAALEVITMEDIPGPPKDLMAKTTSVRSIKLEWKAPGKPNGIITFYKICYVQNKEDINKEEAQNKVQIRGRTTSHELETLEENRTYYFWICARTKIGTGNCTSVVMASTSRGPPSVIGGPESEVTAKWKTTVILNCRFTGFPTPKVTWLDPQGKPLNGKNNDKYNDAVPGKLAIRDLQRKDSKRYVCKVQNKRGSDEKGVTLNVQAPPFPPEDIKFFGINSTAVKISWKSGFNGNSVITKYSLKYRHTGVDWKERELQPESTEFTMNNIRSSKRYFFKMRAKNEIGYGNYSEIKKIRFVGGAILTPTQELEPEDEVQTKASSKTFLKDSAVIATLVGVCLLIAIVIITLALLAKYGYNPGAKLVQRSVDTWRWLVGNVIGISSDERRKRHNRRSGGSSTDGHLGGSSSSLSQPASDNGSLFSLPRSSSRVTESGNITNICSIPPPFSNYTPGSSGGTRVSGSSDEGIGPEIRGEQQHGRSEPSEKDYSQPSLPTRSSNGTPAPNTLVMSPSDYNEPVWQENLEKGTTSTPKRPAAIKVKRNIPQIIGRKQSGNDNDGKDVPPSIPMCKEKVYVTALGNGWDSLPGSSNQATAPVNISPRRPRYEDGHFIIGPDIDRILAYRPPRCYDSTSSEYSSSRDELAQAYEFGKLHHLDDFYGRPTLESASSSGETASSEKDGICHFTTELSRGRPFLIPVAILPPPPNQRLRTRDRKRNTQGAPLNTYYEKDETLV